MKQILIIFSFILVNTLFLISNENVSVNLDFETKSGSKFTNIVKFGINANATDNYDSELKENDLPGHPPSNLHAFMRFFDTNQKAMINSYIDYRAIPDKDTFHIRYIVNFKFESNDECIIRWKNLKLLDSAILIDRFNGIRYKIDMLKVDSLFLDNSAFDEFYIDFYYNKKPSSIVEKNNDLLIFPNPIKVNFRIEHNKNIKTIFAVNIFGEVVEIVDHNLSSLSNGVYSLIITDELNKKYIKKIIKTN